MTERDRAPRLLSRGAALRLLNMLAAATDLDASTRLIPPGVLDEPLRLRLSLPETFSVATGVAVFEGARACLALAPPFPIERAQTLAGYVTEPILGLIEAERTLAVVLVRLGGYSLGLYRGGGFVDSKTGGRFVKNRNRKGGQSQRRFERIREGQIREHFDDVAEQIQAKLLPRADEIEWVVLGGDRRTVQALLTRAPLPKPLAARVHPRFLDTPEPRRDVLERTPGQIWNSRAVILRLPDATT